MNANEYQVQAARTLIDGTDSRYTDKQIMLAWNALGLPGVRYDHANHRLMAQINRSRGGKQLRAYVGSLPPSLENERILHERWKAMRAEMDREPTP